MSKIKKKYNSKILKIQKKKLTKYVKNNYTSKKSGKKDISNYKKEEKHNNVENFILLKVLIIEMIIWFLMFFSIVIILINPQAIVFRYEEYKVGEYLTIDNSNWYVIKDSNSLNDSLVLLSEEDLDLNQDGKIDNNDKIDFQSMKELFNSDIKSRFNSKKIQEVRLLTSNEYISVREQMNFGYSWDEENWLAGESKGKWWLDTKKYGKIFSVKSNGTYSMDSESDRNFVRVVIEVSKFN